MSASWVTTMIGDALLAIELADDLHDLVRGPRVEIAGRLVGQQQLGGVDQRARDRDALLLAAGELARRSCARGRPGRAAERFRAAWLRCAPCAEVRPA